MPGPSGIASSSLKNKENFQIVQIPGTTNFTVQTVMTEDDSSTREVSLSIPIFTSRIIINSSNLIIYLIH